MPIPAPAGMPPEVVDFRTRTIMPATDVDRVWGANPGFLEATIAGELADIHDRLRKRYRVPFSPRPDIVKRWLASKVTPLAYLKLGTQPNDPTMAVVEKQRETADTQIKEAADAHEGLYDLPLLDTADTSAVVKGGPFAYSEASPYDWLDEQAEAVRGR
jgi:hypothetical protein